MKNQYVMPIGSLACLGIIFLYAIFDRLWALSAWLGWVTY